MFECALQKLPLQANCKKTRAGVDVFVVRHISYPNIVHHFDNDIWFSLRQDASVKIIFLQPRWAFLAALGQSAILVA